MLEKRIAIPFLNKELSQWLYRTNNLLREHPRKVGCALFLTACGWIWYENNVVRKDQLVSPTVNNHLVYDVKRVKAEDFDRASTDAQNVTQLQHVGGSSAQRNPEQQAKLDELKNFQSQNGSNATASHGAAMVVKSGQLYVREPHWNIRNSERNWIIMSRDQQQQKDHYWYRVDRSRDDDYARNTYSK
jgi:hypothetical protein